MSPSQPIGGAQSTAMKRQPTGNTQASTTPATNQAQTISTPQPYLTPVPFTSPFRGTSKLLGTPKRGVGGKTVGGTTAVTGLTPNSSFNFTFTSPGMNTASPGMSGLNVPGIEGLAGFATPTPSFSGLDGGAGMGISLSSLGINMGTGFSAAGSAPGKIDDAERKRRLVQVLDTVGKKSGRLSREGLERVGRRCELDMLPEAGKLVMAGKNAVMVDIEFNPVRPESVTRVALELLTASDAMSEHSAKAARVLQNDLTPPPHAASISVMLDDFAENLSRLARMDKLSVPGASCFDAVFGIYRSLTRLYDYERQIAETINDSKQDKPNHVLRKRSGKPSMHLRRRVGLSLDYWNTRGLSSQEDRSPKRQKIGDGDKQRPIECEDVHSMTIECEQSMPALYAPIRVCDDWISQSVVKPAEPITINSDAMDLDQTTAEPVLDWLDPLPALITQTDAESHGVDGLIVPSQPHVRFVARLEPPVVLPMDVAAQAYASVGVDITQDILQSSTFTNLTLPKLQHLFTGAGQSTLQITRNIASPGSQVTKTDDKINLGLFCTTTETALSIKALPFAHPRQLITLLPVLRQYAFIHRLFRNTFPEHQSTKRVELVPSQPGSRLRRDDVRAELDSLLDPTTADTPALDVAFSTSPIPQMTIAVTTKQGLKKLTFRILLNADLEIVHQNIVPESRDESLRQKRIDGLKTALEVSEDLGIWATWVRKTYCGGRL